MDYVEGVTLAQRVADGGPLPVGEATRLLHDVARAVGYAHSRGVIHRDLKPDNIILEAESGRPVVMDFGIAQVHAQTDLERPGYVAGTAPFMSPERAQGAGGDARSDIYALGVTGFFAVTGRLPFDGDTVEEIFIRHAVEPAPELGVYGENLDLTYSQAVARCLEKKPELRFRDGDDLADELARAPELRQRDLPVPLQAFVERVRRYSAASRGLSVLVAVAVLMVIGGVGRGEWDTAAWGAAFLALAAASAAIAVLPVVRRLLREGYTHADLVHALSVDLERGRELRVFEHGKESRRPGRIARLAAYVGLGVAGLGVALSLVESINPVVGAATMVYGFVVALGASVFGWLHTRRRRDLAGEWSLTFWRSRLGAWATRVAGFGLKGVLPRQVRLAPSGIQKIQAWLDEGHTVETNDRV